MAIAKTHFEMKYGPTHGVRRRRRNTSKRSKASSQFSQRRPF